MASLAQPGASTAKSLGAQALVNSEDERLRWAAAMASPDRVGLLTIGKGHQRSVQLSSGRRLAVDPGVVVHQEGCSRIKGKAAKTW